MRSFVARVVLLGGLLAPVLLPAAGCDRAEPAEGEPLPLEEEPAEPVAEPAAPPAGSVAPEGEPNPLDLPPDVSGLLRREMAQLDQGMHRLHSAIVAGRSDLAAETARRIHDSFILKQEITPEQRQQVVGTVPPEFIAKDRALHGAAADLAKAAEADDWARVTELYAAMSRGCVDCHAAHATARFPGLDTD